MSLIIECPHCDHIAHTEEQVELRSTVRCPKCKRSFQVGQPSIEKGQLSQERALAVPDAESSAGEALGTRITGDDDARTAGQPTENGETRNRDKQELFTIVPEEPWFYGSLWKSGLALTFFADAGALLFLLWSLVLFVDVLGTARSEGYTGLAITGLVTSLFVVGLIWFILRLASSVVLVIVDTARNIRYRCLESENTVPR